MTYYHGRGKTRPYYGNYIYITSSLDYAALYSQDGYLYECDINFPKNKIFSIKNIEHVNLLKTQISEDIINRINRNEEILWEQLSYFCNEKFEEPEELFEFLGFKAIFLQERTNIESIYVFNQENVILGKKIKI